MDEKEYTALKKKKRKKVKKNKNKFYFIYNNKRLFFITIILVIIIAIIAIIYIVIKYTLKDNSNKVNELFLKNKKESINDSLIGEKLFLKYKEDIEFKNEEFENNFPITVNTVKNILSKNSNNNDNINNINNNINLNISNISLETNKQITTRYIKNY